MRFPCLTLAALLATGAVPAHAAYTTLDYTGFVSRIYVPGAGSEADIVLNAPVLFSVTVDLSRFVTFGTFRLPNGATGAPMVVHPAGISLYNDPAATFSITLGSHTWTQADYQYDSGYVTPSGIGPNPFLAYDGSPSQLIGLSTDVLNNEGIEFDSDPADYFLQYQSHPIYGGDPNGVQFAVDYYTAMQDPTGLVTSDEILALRAAALAAGQVPEPSSWALLLLGGVALWTGSRRKRDSTRGMALMPA